MQLPGMMQINECEDGDDEYDEEDVDWYTGDCDNELDGITHTVGTPTDDPELLEQFDGILEDADASASQVYASANRSFQEARELLSRVECARGYFPVVGSGPFDGLAQPSADRKPAKFRGKGKKGKRKRTSSSQKSRKSPNLGTPGNLPETRPNEVGATRSGPHHAPDQCMLCRQVGHRASECPNEGKATALSPVKRASGTYALGCAVFDAPCYGATVEETEQDQNENDIEDFAAFTIKSLGGFAILDGRATKTVSGFMSGQPAADQYEDATIETTDVGFTFAGGETEAASTNL